MATVSLQLIYLENTAIGHNKFYRIEVKHTGTQYEIHTTWGKLRTIGQHKIHSAYTDRFTCMTAAEAVADSKKAKGYIVRQETTSMKKLAPDVTQPQNIALNRFGDLDE